VGVKHWGSPKLAVFALKNLKATYIYPENEIAKQFAMGYKYGPNLIDEDCLIPRTNLLAHRTDKSPRWMRKWAYILTKARTPEGGAPHVYIRFNQPFRIGSFRCKLKDCPVSNPKIKMEALIEDEAEALWFSMGELQEGSCGMQIAFTQRPMTALRLTALDDSINELQFSYLECPDSTVAYIQPPPIYNDGWPEWA